MHDEAKLRAALGDLPADQRAAVVLAYAGGLSYREVAQRLGLAEATVKDHLRQGLAQLRTLLIGPDLATA